MFSSIGNYLLLGALTGTPPTPADGLWELDRTSVAVGGCVTITIRRPGGKPRFRDVSVGTGDGESIALSMSGPAITEGEETHVLLWLSPRALDPEEPAATRPSRVRFARSSRLPASCRSRSARRSSPWAQKP